MNILFVDAFDDAGREYGNFRAQGFFNHGHKVFGFDDKKVAQKLGISQRDDLLLRTLQEQSIDLALFVKCLEGCGGVSLALMEKIKEHCQVGYIFIEPMCSITDEICKKVSIADFAIVEKKNTYENLKKYNKNTFHFYEGCDHRLEKKQDIPIRFDVSFLGNIYGNRAEILQAVKPQPVVIQDAFGNRHSQAVSASKINLNLCTAEGASNRIWKILWAEGFVLSDDWCGREEHFVDGKHLVIFNGTDDLNKKILYYLEHEDERLQIAKAGYERVVELNTNLDNFAKKITEAAQSLMIDADFASRALNILNKKKTYK